jgi:hypothetical protein
MDTFSIYNDVNNQINTETKPSSNVLRAGAMVFGMSIMLSSARIANQNQMPNQKLFAGASSVTGNSSQTYRHGTFSPQGIYSNIVRNNYSERYKNIVQSAWFQTAYRDKSLGEIVGIEA